MKEIIIAIITILPTMATLIVAVQNSTDTILNSQGRYVMNPPCYTGCGCGNLY